MFTYNYSIVSACYFGYFMFLIFHMNIIFFCKIYFKLLSNFLNLYSQGELRSQTSCPELKPPPTVSTSNPVGRILTDEERKALVQSRQAAFDRVKVGECSSSMHLFKLLITPLRTSPTIRISLKPLWVVASSKLFRQFSAAVSYSCYTVFPYNSAMHFNRVPDQPWCIRY